MAIAADGGPADKLRDEASFACQSVFDVRSGADAELVRLADAKAEQLAEVLGSACTAGEASRLGDALVQPVMDGSAEDVVVAGPAATVRLTEAQWASRSEERRVGKECVRPCRSRWSPYH